MLGGESSTLLSLPGAKVPSHFRSRERKFQGAKVPGNESSSYGTFAPGSESTRERKFHNSSEITAALCCLLHVLQQSKDTVVGLEKVKNLKYADFTRTLHIETVLFRKMQVLKHVPLLISCTLVTLLGTWQRPALH